MHTVIGYNLCVICILKKIVTKERTGLSLEIFNNKNYTCTKISMYCVQSLLVVWHQTADMN